MELNARAEGQFGLNGAIAENGQRGLNSGLAFLEPYLFTGRSSMHVEPLKFASPENHDPTRGRSSSRRCGDLDASSTQPQAAKF
jgi:hypothetical protein